jgi:hypothetical protein
MTFGYSQTEPPLGVPKSRRAKTCLLSGLADPLGTKPFQRFRGAYLNPNSSRIKSFHALRSRQLEPHRPVLGFPENPEPKEWTALPLQIDPLNQLIGGKVLIGLLIRK